MALINYIEPVNVGSFFSGIAALIFVGVLSYLIYQVYIKFIKYMDLSLNHDAKYILLQDVFLDRLAEKHDIDLPKELIKKKMLGDVKRTSLRKRIEDEIYAEMFNEKTIGAKNK